jgi:hypothetical protein
MVTITIVTAGVWAVYFAERHLPILEPEDEESERWKERPSGNLIWRRA